MGSVWKHGADCIDSESDLRKVNLYARIFQVISIARTSSSLSIINIPSHIPRPPMSSSTTVYECAYFQFPMPDSTKIDVFRSSFGIHLHHSHCQQPGRSDACDSIQQSWYELLQTEEI
ncbi:hypothetical protein BG003_004836 [Podila horticola]|nr:hypothetical protein BG003_004836 [Podila horticola]